tara:strand:+ start:204 stop:1463 length:1260 start_codon:yes stop_codon:yes gene_type:complete
MEQILDFYLLPKKSIINKNNVINLAILSPVFLFIIFFNRYIFAESNLPYFTTLIIIALIFRVRFRLKSIMLFNPFVISMILFIIYTIFRIDNGFSTTTLNNSTNSFYKFYQDIINLNIYLLLFILGSILSFNKQKPSEIIWLLISVYLLMYIVKSLFSLAELQTGAHLGAGDVVISLIPFVLLGLKGYKYRQRYTNIILFLVFVFLALIGTRIASLSVLIMILIINIWPYIIKNKIRYNLVFFITIMAIALLYLVYIRYMTHSGESLISGSNIGVLQKSTNTRFIIWVHLLATIQDNIFFGIGSLNSTTQIAPESYLSFDMHRKNLSSHSTYFELLYRLGVVGVFLFLTTMFNLWALFWKGINLWEIRIASSLIIAILFIASSQVSIIYSYLELYWGFIWVFFGIAFGSIIKKNNTFKT